MLHGWLFCCPRVCTPSSFNTIVTYTSRWDPVTGLGTPNYPKMLAYYLSLPWVRDISFRTRHLGDRQYPARWSWKNEPASISEALTLHYLWYGVILAPSLMKESIPGIIASHFLRRLRVLLDFGVALCSCIG
jgi:hypothetical protein